jgi:4-aminobutyrate aminotransferase-like enzyme
LYNIALCHAVNVTLNLIANHRYPLEEHVRENAAEDKRCLAHVEEVLEQSAQSDVPCVGVVIEPVQAEGGDNHGSQEWFRGLQESSNITIILIFTI